MGKSMVSCKFSLKPIHWFMIFGDLYSMDRTWPYLATAAGRPAGEAAAAARQALLHWSPSYSWSLRANWAPHIHDYPWRRSHTMQWNVNIFACYTMICIDLHWFQPGFLFSSRYPPCIVPNTATSTAFFWWFWSWGWHPRSLAAVSHGFVLS